MVNISQLACSLLEVDFLVPSDFDEMARYGNWDGEFVLGR
jgi:hypothetical protein